MASIIKRVIMLSSRLFLHRQVNVKSKSNTVIVVVFPTL